MLVSTHVVPQAVRFPPQFTTHLPFEQTVPCAQALPQAPQLVWSVLVSMHWLPHLVVPPGQTQAPPTQLVPPEQVTPQPPQFLLLVFMSKQDPPHRIRGLVQTAAHMLWLQNCVAVHFSPQPPQLE